MDPTQSGGVTESPIGTVGGYVQLSPLTGGAEWEDRPGQGRPLMAREELSARLAVRNAQTVRERRAR